MKLSTSLVSVKKITSNTPRSAFREEDLEQVAQLILDAEGVINPIILRRTSLESYEVVDGDLEYHAAARAREIDPRRGEMIGAFILEAENEKVLQEQVNLLRKSKDSVSIPSSNTESINSSINETRFTNMEMRLTNIETRSDNRFNELKLEQNRQIEYITQRLNDLETRLPKPIEPIEALNTLSLQELAAKIGRAVKGRGSILEKIINEREENGDFKSCADVIKRVNGLGDKTMINIVDTFSAR